MLERPSLTPLSSAVDIGLGDVLAHVQSWRTDTLRTIATLHELKLKVDAGFKQLENPKAAIEYLEFFVGFLTRASDDLGVLAQQLAEGPTVASTDAMRQLASNAAVEQRRTVVFRDKWVNKPLPYEQMRSLLTQIASEVRDQLADYKDLTAAASVTSTFVPPPLPPPEPKPEGFDRRALFRRIVRPLGDDQAEPGSERDDPRDAGPAGDGS